MEETLPAFEIIIDGRYTLFHKHLSLPEFLFEALRLNSLKSDLKFTEYTCQLLKSAIKTSKTPEILDFINSELITNENLVKNLQFSEISPINVSFLSELFKKTVFKIKILDNFIQDNPKATIIIPISSPLKQNYYQNLLIANYSANILQSIKFLPKSSLTPEEFPLNPNSTPLFITHKPAIFAKFPEKLLRFYFNNKFYNRTTKETIEKSLKNITFEIDLLNFLPSALEFLEKKAKDPSKIIRIGCFVLAKKIEDVYTKKIMVSKFPFQFIPIDIRYPIENRDFDIVIHKITDVVKYYGCGQLPDLFNKNFKEFYEKNKQKIVFIDGLEGIKVVISRVSFQAFFEKIFTTEEFQKKLEALPFKAVVKVPKMIEIDNKTSLELILEKMQKKGLNFPIITKTKVALGETKTHMMAVALDPVGLKVIEEHEIFSKEPHIIQELINHDETIFKIYVIGEKSYYYTRQSLPNMTLEVLGQPFFFFDSQIPFKEQMDFLKKRKGDFKEKNVKIEEGLFDVMTQCISEKLGFSLYGYDLVKDCKNGDVHIVDINYFPGFKFEGDLQKLFMDFYLKKVKK